ncbi:Cytochrome b-c1 complex subunit 6 [Colletotrichum orbiculare MAFF 240422]|uniref:Cytochrome b-c1 complex subunit 6, mitochondrial n=1 Tax=Colletotrichum orbiculare (strain 104-T / ATCC 96160 / CBS 514.97 / LARS 414 / MAFF 240422) TaxID=1213857 RepID=N4V272_COLOR|nr:Cytochrome b-c1 complex subunit 6 [Colletotrichum orbiculare MAFF 240422]
MGFWDTITDLAEAAMPWATVEAEAPAAEEKEEETPAEETKEEPEAEAEAEEEEDEEDEEDEDDEEEPVDPKDQIEEECKESKACAPAKHHYDECVERVTAAADSEDGAKEDCVEEFFHLAHCATQCAAPRLWAQLK